MSPAPASILLTDLGMVERIEAVRGPGSALYGTGAFFGVIHIGLLDRLPHTGRADLIRSEGEGTKDDPLVYRNVPAQVWTAGAEIELLREIFRGVLGSAQYAWQRTRVGSLLAEEALPSSPVHLLGFKLVLPVYGRAVRLGTRLFAQGGRRHRTGALLAPALLWDIVLFAKVRGLGLSYHAGVKNLLDWDVRLPVGEDIADTTVPLAGRSFVAGLAYSF